MVENPAEGVELPRLKGKAKKKWALMPKEAGALLKQIQPLKVRAMVALAITAGLRRGELIAARKALEEANSEIAVTEVSYRGHIDTPKTEARERKVPLDQWIMGLLKDWRRLSKHTKPDDFIFATRTGKQDNPVNILRRYVRSACDAVKIRRASWNTFRRTFSTWLHHQAIPGKTIADMMGHADVPTQFIYIQSEDHMDNSSCRSPVIRNMVCRSARTGSYRPGDNGSAAAEPDDPLPNRSGDARHVRHAQGRQRIRRLIAAFERIFGATMFFGTDKLTSTAKVVQRSRFSFFREAQIWYNRRADDSMPSDEFENVIVLSDEFYQEAISHPIPTDLAAVKLLAPAPAALDLHWLKAAEKSFEFWDNEEDAVYDKL